MERRSSWCAALLALQLLLCWASATSRNPAPIDSGEPATTTMANAELGGSVGSMKIGSSPPSCDNKCYGCTPCEAAQVPATSSGRSRLRVQYTNYEPEGWKCKCGPSFYSP